VQYVTGLDHTAVATERRVGFAGYALTLTIHIGKKPDRQT